MDREKIETKYTWDLTKIFANIDEFNNLYEETKQQINDYKKYENIMGENANNFYNAINDYHNISRNLEKLYSYTSLQYDENTSNNTNQALELKVRNLYDEITKVAFFITPTVLKKEKEEIEVYYKEEPKLLDYKIMIEKEFRYKEHTLSDEEEKLLSNMSKLFNSSTTYELLKNSDITFDNITDESGSVVELTDSNYSLFIESQNRTIRKNAFKTLYKTYKQFKNTFASTLSGHINETITYAKVKKYNSAIESSLYQDELTIDIYNNLINTVSNNLDKLFRYYDLKKDLLKLDELHLYDIYTPIVGELDKKYTFEEAKKIVLKALSPLGEDYINILKEGYENRWVDVYPTKSKRGGAYSGGCYDTYPYILLNFQGKQDDVSTLAHESGHSMHSYYARTNQDYQYGEYSIFVAEVASTVNEVLLYKHLLKTSNDDKEKLFILDNLMTLFKGTIYRQTMFAEFEKILYEDAEQDIPLTSDYISDRYYELNKKYFGDNVVIDEEIKYEWCKIPHFYYNFYVYKYATGLAAACKIASDILSNKENAVENYKKFLSCGTTLSPIDSLKLAGVDLTDKKVIESALNMFDETIEDFKKIYKANQVL